MKIKYIAIILILIIILALTNSDRIPFIEYILNPTDNSTRSDDSELVVDQQSDATLPSRHGIALENQYNVFAPDVSLAELRRFAKQAGGRLIKRGKHGLYQFYFPSRKSYRYFKNHFGDKIVSSPNSVVEIPVVAGEPADLKGLGIPLNQVNKSLFQQLGITPEQAKHLGSGVVVAVIDTGLTTTSGLNVAGQIDLIPDADSEGSARAHGQTVASLLAGQASGPFDGGVAQSASILAIRALDGSGKGTVYEISMGIYEAVDAGAQIINLSCGGVSESAVLAQAIAYANKNNVLVVAATGNEGADKFLAPASYDSVIAVGAEGSSDNPTAFTNIDGGANLLAPGEHLLAQAGDGQYTLVSGTSFASPVVAGTLAALISEEDYAMSNSDAALALYEEADRNVASLDSEPFTFYNLALDRVLDDGESNSADPAIGNVRYDEESEELILNVYNRGNEIAEGATVEIEINGVTYETTAKDIAGDGTVKLKADIPVSSGIYENIVEVNLKSSGKDDNLDNNSNKFSIKR